MMEELLRELFADRNETDIKVDNAIINICEFNNLDLIETMLLNNILTGFSRQTIADKVNALATPFKTDEYKITH